MGGRTIVHEGQLEQADLEEIAALLRADSAVSALCLSWCYLIPADLEELGSAMVCCESLQKLDFSHNFLGDKGVQTLLEHLGPSVTTIILADNDISDVGARALIERLTRLGSPLVDVSIDFNRVSTKVLQRLQRETTTKIKRLQMRTERNHNGKAGDKQRLLQVICKLELENKGLRRERGSLKASLQRVRASKKAADQRADLAAQQLENAAADVLRARNETTQVERHVEALKEHTKALVEQLEALSGDSPLQLPEGPPGEPSDHMLSFTCKICHDRAISCVFIPCGHLAACLDCGNGLRNCPMCRGLNTDVLRCYST